MSLHVPRMSLRHGEVSKGLEGRAGKEEIVSMVFILNVINT